MAATSCMYSTCLFCTQPLGRNAVLESFPVGRRLAFDPAKGRLWVVCTTCRRWNLTPLEERWEAIEDAERRFRDTKLRMSTGQIGLARLAEGLELVRVGAPQRPEIAAWRYGEQFSRRRRKQLVVGGSIAAGATLVAFGASLLGVSSLVAFEAASIVRSGARDGFRNSTAARVRASNGRLVRVRRKDLVHSQLLRGDDGGMAFHLRSAGGDVTLSGEDARAAARRIFPAINRRGGTSEDVSLAVARLEHAGDTERFLAETAERGTRLTREGGLLSLSTSLGLAIEMALHEEQERIALEGELEALEEAWREAEEIGAIADSLFLPESVERALRALKGAR